MPASDLNHDTVIRCLNKAGWTIIKEQVSLLVGQEPDNLRRLYIDIAAQSQDAQLVLIEVKSLAQSPVHQFMMLVGQYLVYRGALDYLGDNTPLYVAISEVDYQTIVEHPIGQQVINQTLTAPIPFVVYDPIQAEIIRWIPTL